MKCEPAFLEWTVHIKAVQQARELTAAVGCLTSTECFPIAEAVLEGVAGTAEPAEEEVPDALAQIAGLVLEDVNRPSHMWPCGWSEEGRQVLAMLRAAVFPNAWPGATLMDLVLNTTLQQAAAVCRVCDSLLREVICDSINCVPLLLLAKQQRWAALEARCLQVALENPMDLGPELPSLPRDDMMHILGSDDLKIESEMEAWRILCQWLACDTVARAADMATYLTRGVRILLLSRDELHELDTHPALCSAALYSQLVAAQPRSCLRKPLEPATPPPAAKAAAPATPVTGPEHSSTSDGGEADGGAAGGGAASPCGMLFDVVPMQLQSPPQASGRAEAASPAQAGSPADNSTRTAADAWMMSDDDWEDVTHSDGIGRQCAKRPRTV